MKYVGCRCWVLGLLAMGWSLGAAEPPEVPVAAVQAFLKEQRLYSGPVDGMESPATAGAVRRYQILHGFTATGRLDEGTLAAMLTPVPHSVKLTESDKEVLKELDANPPPVAEERREPIPPGPPVPVVASPSPTPGKGRKGATARSVHRARPERVSPARISRSLPGD